MNYNIKAVNGCLSLFLSLSTLSPSDVIVLCHRRNPCPCDPVYLCHDHDLGCSIHLFHMADADRHRNHAFQKAPALGHEVGSDSGEVISGSFAETEMVGSAEGMEASKLEPEGQVVVSDLKQNS